MDDKRYLREAFTVGPGPKDANAILLSSARS
jgi:hypothetical protein